jgi:methylated-DNA-[protein]-cysteine S-methyltransferase
LAAGADKEQELTKMNSAIQKVYRQERMRSGDRFSDEIEAVATLRVTPFDSGLQWMAIAWTDDELQGIVFGHASPRQAEDAVLRVHRLPRHAFSMVPVDELDDAPQWVRELVEDLKRFTEGRFVDFSDVPISQAHLTPFSRRVIAACRRISWGKTSSYGELATKCGASGAARAVGSVMAKNRFPLVVPCHRVLGAGGKLGGYSAPGGLQTKRHLLEMETPNNSPFRLSNRK